MTDAKKKPAIAIAYSSLRMDKGEKLALARDKIRTLSAKKPAAASRPFTAILASTRHRCRTTKLSWGSVSKKMNGRRAH
jgi:hypothetical protein